MLQWLKDVIRPIRRQDQRFGPMRYLRDTRTWEGWTEFSPVKGNVEVLLSGGPEGPTENQRQFIELLESRYPALVSEVRAHPMEAAAAQPNINGDAVRFTLVAVDLPAEVTDDMSWELCYETEPKSWCFAVQMRGWMPRSVSVECWQPVVHVWRRTETGEAPRRQGATTENTGSI